jgi:hypothetical protein
LRCHKLKFPASELEAALFAIISKQAQVILNTDSLGGGYALDAQTENQADCERTIARNQDAKRALVDALIDKVRVFPGNRIEIEWKVADFTS